MFQQRIKRKMNSERGSVILWTMMFVALFFLTISTVTVITILEIRQSTKIDSSTAAYLVAEAGVERAKNYAGSSFFDPTDPSNPATGVKDTGTKPGQINGNKYTFQVVKAAAGTSEPYDSPQRNCDNSGAGVTTAKYCYYSQATVGNIKRKIDGEKKDVGLDKGKTADLYSSDTQFDSSYTYNFPKVLNMTPSGASSPTVFTYSVTIDGLTSGSWRIGLLDTTYPADPTTNKYTVMININSSTKTFTLYSQSQQNTGQGGYGINTTSDYSASKTLASLPSSIKLTLVYRKGRSTSLYIKNAQDGSCLGVVTTPSSRSITPYHAYFSNMNIDDNDGIDENGEVSIKWLEGKIKMIDNLGNAIYLKNLYLRAE